MAILCPLNNKKKLETNTCNDEKCKYHIPSLQYHCLSLHCQTFNVNAHRILNDIYGKQYKMQVALSIKATRIAMILNNLKPRKLPIENDFEKKWYDRIEEAGIIASNCHWLDMIKENEGKKIADRMAQVLNTMDAHEYSLLELCQEYKELFGNDIDCIAFGFHKNENKEFESFYKDRI